MCFSLKKPLKWAAVPTIVKCAVRLTLFLHVDYRMKVHSPSWMPHQSYLMQPAVSSDSLQSSLCSLKKMSPSDSLPSACPLQQGTVLTPTMDHAMSIQPTSMMGPLTQQLSHLSLGSTGTVSITRTRTHVTVVIFLFKVVVQTFHQFCHCTTCTF